ncbi:MAG: hypothetical protein E6G71_07250 [Alphaproteobacteria bacterium]|nr:MAG: hypothetical protein E6G71_07250 [Alphaproteobacteria bacterium]
MNWAWVTSLDQLWRSPTFPMWLTLAASGFFGIIVLITLLRAEKSVANGALTVITLLAIGIAATATIRGFGPGQGASAETRSSQSVSAGLPALSCIDDLAGETVLTACEKVLFGSAESTAAALSYAASQITWLTAFGDVAAANANMTPELQMVRRAVERDRYGLMAYVLAARDHCTPSDCAAFRAITDRNQIVANMNERTYEGLIVRYAPSWNMPAVTPAPVAALPPSMPLGKPTNAEFPTAASTPPISIMTPEPGQATTPTAPRPASSSPPSSSPPLTNAPLPSPRPTPALAAAKKPAAPKPARMAAPVQLAPAAPAPAAAAPEPAPSAAND